MILPTIAEISLKGVEDRGVPNAERIVLQANEDVNLGAYGLMVGIRSGVQGYAFPARDNLLWFGDAVVRKSDWIIVYTRPGRASDRVVYGTQRAYFLYWGRERTVFNFPEAMPILFRMDGVHLSEDFLALPLTQK